MITKIPIRNVIAMLALAMSWCLVASGKPESSSYANFISSTWPKEARDSAVQAINTYLSAFNLPSSRAVVIQQLRQMIDNIERLKVGFLDAAVTRVHENLLLGHDHNLLIALGNEIIATSKSCTSRNMNYLAALANQFSHQGGSLREYSIKLISMCVADILSRLSYDSLMQSFPDQLIQSMTHLAIERKLSLMQMIYGHSTPLAHGMPPVTAEDLEEISLSPERLEEFAYLVIASFRKSGYFQPSLEVFTKRGRLIWLGRFLNETIYNPCEQIISSSNQMDLRFDEYDDFMIILQQALAKLRASGKRLDIRFEIWRICLELKRQKVPLWQQLEMQFTFHNPSRDKWHVEYPK